MQEKYNGQLLELRQAQRSSLQDRSCLLRMLRHGEDDNQDKF
jgi:hypothetical protein